MVKVLVVQHIECENLGLLADYLDKNNIEFDYVVANEKENFPDKIGGYFALVLLGGPISVYDNYPFFKREEELIRDTLSKKIPILGICLGSQWLAKVLGAKVYKGRQKEIGWYKIKFINTSNDKIFYDFKNEIIVFQWHGDTFNIPPNCTRLALSDLYPNQAFRFRDNVYALQFHLEVTEPMIKEWIIEYKKELEELKVLIDPHRIIKETKKNAKIMHKMTEKFCTRFIQLIKTR